MEFCPDGRGFAGCRDARFIQLRDRLSLNKNRWDRLISAPIDPVRSDAAGTVCLSVDIFLSVQQRNNVARYSHKTSEACR